MNEEPKKPGAPAKNQNAKKDSTADRQTTFRMTQGEWNAWVTAAGGKGVAAWIRAACNAAASYEP